MVRDQLDVLLRVKPRCFTIAHGRVIVAAARAAVADKLPREWRLASLMSGLLIRYKSGLSVDT